MAQQNINYGTVPNDGTGDVYRVAIIKIQNNFTDLYTNKVDKTATIALTGGATGTATAMAGATVVIPITGLNMGSATAGTLAVARGGTGVTTATGTGANVQAVSPALTGTPTVPTAARGDNSTKAASTAYVDQAGLSYYGNGTGLTSNTTLTVASIGKWFEVQSAGLTISLPVTGVPVGGTYTFKALQAFTLDAGTGNINPSLGSATAKLSVPRGSLVTLAANNATGSWYVVNQYTNPFDMALAGVPTAPTAATAANTTQVATTAFVQAVNSADTGSSATAIALKTGRNFSVAGGATAADQSFNGTADVVLTVTALDVSKATAGTLAVARGGTGVTTSTGTGSTVLSASPALTGTPTVPTAAAGTNTAQVASMAAVQEAVTGYLTKAITGGAVTLTEAEVSNAHIIFTGTLTSNAVVTFPNVRRIWLVGNVTAGAFTVTIKGVTAATEEAVRGDREFYALDTAGAMGKAAKYVRDVVDGGTGTTTSTGTGSTVLSASPALTGTPTVPTAATATSTTQVASTAFVQAVNSADTGGSATSVALKTARSFSVSGGATAAAQTFNGTSDVVLNVTALDVSKATAGTLPVARGGTGTTTSTGTGANVQAVSPTFTGTPYAPTASKGTDNTQIATTAFANAAVASPFIPSAYRFSSPNTQISPITFGWAGRSQEWALTLEANGNLSFNAYNNGTWIATPLNIDKSGNAEFGGRIVSNGFNNKAGNYGLWQLGDIGSSFVDWNGGAVSAVQMDCPRNDAAYMLWRATKWGQRHLAAMHVYAYNSDTGEAGVSMAVANGAGGIAQSFRWMGAGDYVVYRNIVAGGSITPNSDIRLKNVIGRIKNPMEKIRGFENIIYTRKDIDNGVKAGYSAQSVEKYFPEGVVKTAPGENQKAFVDDEVLSVDYNGVSVLHNEALVEHDDKLIAHTEELESLKEELKTLKELVKHLLPQT